MHDNRAAQQDAMDSAPEEAFALTPEARADMQAAKRLHDAAGERWCSEAARPNDTADIGQLAVSVIHTAQRMLELHHARQAREAEMAQALRDAKSALEFLEGVILHDEGHLDILYRAYGAIGRALASAGEAGWTP